MCMSYRCNQFIDNSVLVPDKMMERRVNISKEHEGNFKEFKKIKKESTYVNLE